MNLNQVQCEISSFFQIFLRSNKWDHYLYTSFFPFKKLHGDGDVTWRREDITGHVTLDVPRYPWDSSSLSTSCPVLLLCSIATGKAPSESGPWSGFIQPARLSNFSLKTWRQHYIDTGPHQYIPPCQHAEQPNWMRLSVFFPSIYVVHWCCTHCSSRFAPCPIPGEFLPWGSFFPTQPTLIYS